MIPEDAVTEDLIEESERLRAKGDFATALEMSQQLLARTDDGDFRVRILFNIVNCAACVDRQEIVESAIAELEGFPKPEISRVLANLRRAWAETSLGRPANALHLLDMGLATGLFEAGDMRVHKYQMYLFKGEALLHLRRPEEALEWLDKAHALYPTDEGASSIEERKIYAWVEPNIQVNRANCLLALDRLDESVKAAQEVMKFEDHPDLCSLALQYVGECRVWQGRIQEALNVYAELKKRLPCRLIDEKRMNQVITNCMACLEKQRPPGRPS
jgi:tetratricopeptide (TPR) repeat protein